MLPCWLVLLFGLSLATLGHCTTVCPDDTWAYYASTGSCYIVNTTVAVSYSVAASTCSNYSSYIVSVDSTDEQTILDNLLQFNYNKVWIGLSYNSSTNSYAWTDGWFLNYSSRWSSSNPNPLSGTNAYMYKEPTSTLLAYRLESLWYSAQPSSVSVDTFICEYEGPRCPAVQTVQNATADTWRNYLNVTVTWNCLEGYRLPDPISNGSSYYSQSQSCVQNSSNPAAVYWSGNAPVACMPKMCNSTPQAFPTGSIYPTCDICNSAPPFAPGTIATYTCQAGFKMPYGNTTTQQVICGNSPTDPNSNIWKPGTMNCVFVHCPSLVTIAPNNSLSPSGTDFYGKNIRQGASQFFTQYGSIVNFTCTPGFIYQDGLVTRLYKCNAVQTVGFWTINTPNAAFSSPGCNPVVCPNQTIVIQNYISGNGLNVTSGDYKQTQYNAQFSLACVSGWSFPDGSNSKTLTCTATQLWSDGSNSYSTVPGCTGGTNLVLKAGQQYVPPQKESPTAAADGSTIMVLVGILLAVIIIMDIAVLPRDLAVLRRNWARLRERCGRKPKQHEEWKDPLNPSNDTDAIIAQQPKSKI